MVPKVELREVGLPKFGQSELMPRISRQEYEERIQLVREKMQQRRLDVLVVYADREHSANMAWLTGYDPRFEEALFLLSVSGRHLLLVGNEGLGYIGHSLLALTTELFQEFSLMGQPRDRSRSLSTVLRSFGVRPTTLVGCIGWKYYDSSKWMELPAWIVDTLRRLAAGVRNVGDILMNPADGLRLFNSVDQIALFEYAATRTSEGIAAAIRKLRVGVRECELERAMHNDGLPLSCHTMVSFGDKARMGLSSPSDRTAQLGDALTMAFGLWGSLTCRAGMVVGDEKELGAELREFFPAFAKNYFATVARWYETIGVGVSAGEVYRAVEQERDKKLFRLALNPGHYISLDEWVHSPFVRGSDIRLKSGMALQADLIPIPRGPFCCANMEDGVVLADDRLQAALAARYPPVAKRMRTRRDFMSEILGIRLADCVLPLSNTPAVFRPYLLCSQVAIRVTGRGARQRARGRRCRSGGETSASRVSLGSPDIS